MRHVTHSIGSKAHPLNSSISTPSRNSNRIYYLAIAIACSAGFIFADAAEAQKSKSDRGRTSGKSSQLQVKTKARIPTTSSRSRSATPSRTSSSSRTSSRAAAPTRSLSSSRLQVKTSSRIPSTSSRPTTSRSSTQPTTRTSTSSTRGRQLLVTPSRPTTVNYSKPATPRTSPPSRSSSSQARHSSSRSHSSHGSSVKSHHAKAKAAYSRSHSSHDSHRSHGHHSSHRSHGSHHSHGYHHPHHSKSGFRITFGSSSHRHYHSSHKTCVIRYRPGTTVRYCTHHGHGHKSCSLYHYSPSYSRSTYTYYPRTSTTTCVVKHYPGSTRTYCTTHTHGHRSCKLYPTTTIHKPVVVHPAPTVYTPPVAHHPVYTRPHQTVIRTYPTTTCVSHYFAGTKIKYCKTHYLKPNHQCGITRVDAWELIGKGHYSDAISVFNHYMIHEPRNGKHQIGYALALSLKGDHSHAILAMRKAMTVDPYAIQNIPVSTHMRNLISSEIKHFREDLYRLPNKGDISFMLASLELLTGHTQAANTYLDYAEHYGDRSLAFDNLASVIANQVHQEHLSGHH